MSSSGGTVSVVEAGAHAPGRFRVPWIWPAGARGVLALTASAAALWLALASGGADLAADPAIVTVPTLRLDVNTAPPQVLGALPHLGPALVRQLVRARESRPLASLEDAGRRVRGLGPATRAQVAPHLRFEPEALRAREDFERPARTGRGAQPRAPRRTMAGRERPKTASRQPWLVAESRVADPRTEISNAEHE
jgi:hypothetical protein